MTKEEIKPDAVVALDIGTSKVKAVIAAVMADGEFQILGYGVSECQGMKLGYVSDINLLIKSITRAVNKAEVSSDLQIRFATVSVSGDHIGFINEKGMVAISDGVVSEYDIQDATQTARNIKMKDSTTLLHAIQQEFIIDDQTGIKNPLGQQGHRMEVKVHLITAHTEKINNLQSCVERVGNIAVDRLVFSGLASAEAVLSDSEKEMGALVVDIGAGTMDCVIYQHGAPWASFVIPNAGNYVTSDICSAFHTPIESAEKCKIDCGSADPDSVSTDPFVSVDIVGTNERTQVKVQVLATVIAYRYRDMFEMLSAKVEEFRTKLLTQHMHLDLGAGVVLTGGASRINGIKAAIRPYFDCPVRIGRPNLAKGMTDDINVPDFATAVGLLKFAADQVKYENDSRDYPGSSGQGLMRRALGWLKNMFYD